MNDITNGWDFGTELTGVDTSLGDGFGNSVAIDSTFVIVGASHQSNQKGAVYIFAVNGTFLQKLSNFSSIGDQFGYSVAIYNSQIIVGAPSNTISNSAIYVFAPSSNGNFVLAVKLTADTGTIGYSVAIYGEIALLTSTVTNALGSVYYINNITALETASASNTTTTVFPAAYFAVVIIFSSIVYIIVVTRFMFRRNYLLGKYRHNNQPQPQRQANEMGPMGPMGNPPFYTANTNVTVQIYSNEGTQVNQNSQNSPSGLDYCCFIVLIFFLVSLICLIIVSTACRAPEQNNLLGITWLSGNSGCGFSVIMASPFLLLMVLPVLCCKALCSCTCCACSCCYCDCCNCPCNCDCCPTCNCPCNCPANQYNCNSCNNSSTNNCCSSCNSSSTTNTTSGTSSSYNCCNSCCPSCNCN